MAVIDNIFDQARAAPDRTAVVYNGQTVSYADFAARIGAAIRHFRDHGLQAGGFAVVSIFRLIDEWVVVLALQGLGLTTVSVRSLDEVDRLDLSDIRCIVVADDEPAAPAGLGSRLMRVPAGAFAAADPAPGLDGLLTAPPGGHVLLTSGTTGSPKKALSTPATEAINIARRLGPLAVSSQSVVAVFDFRLWSGIGYFSALCGWSVGGGVLIHQGADKHASLNGHGITHLLSTPASLSRLLAAPAGAFSRDDGILVIIGGGTIPRALAAAVSERLSRRLCSVVASTEAGYWCVTPIEGLEDLRWHQINPACQVQIVDEAGAILPVGEIGRVRVSTGAVSAYLGDEATSRACFGEGYFYPGDLGQFRADGRLALHGRVTDVINFMGAKVAVAPLEQALQERFAADEVCIFSMQSEGTDEDLHIAIQARTRLSRDELAVIAKTDLKPFPSVYFHYVDDFPRNEMGKVRRLALKQQLIARQSGPKQDR
jgi:acyl-CoA synthetase (AMP-forming)/AMP-acid ligase II